MPDPVERIPLTIDRAARFTAPPMPPAMTADEEAARLAELNAAVRGARELSDQVLAALAAAKPAYLQAVYRADSGHGIYRLPDADAAVRRFRELEAALREAQQREREALVAVSAFRKQMRARKRLAAAGEQAALDARRRASRPDPLASFTTAERSRSLVETARSAVRELLG